MNSDAGQSSSQSLIDLVSPQITQIQPHPFVLDVTPRASGSFLSSFQSSGSLRKPGLQCKSLVLSLAALLLPSAPFACSFSARSFLSAPNHSRTRSASLHRVPLVPFIFI